MPACSFTTIFVKTVLGAAGEAARNLVRILLIEEAYSAGETKKTGVQGNFSLQMLDLEGYFGKRDRPIDDYAKDGEPEAV